MAVALTIFVSCSLEKKENKKQLQGVVVILLDTLRADHLSCYGYHRITDPFIRELSTKGVLFKQVVAPSSWTLPSHLCFFSGNDISGLKLTPGTQAKLHQSLIKNFQSSGFKTAAFTEGGFVSKEFGMDAGFDYFYEEEGAVQLLLSGQKWNPKYPGVIENTFLQAKKWLKNHKKDKFFLFIHTYEPHVPYTNGDFTKGLKRGRIGGGVFSLYHQYLMEFGTLVPTPHEREYVEALYDGDILNCDRHVGDFAAFLKELGIDDRTLIIVTSDHGEELGERYPNMLANHAHSLYDELLLVPLILYNPLKNYPRRVVESQTRLIDVIPTLLDIFDISHEECHGKSLLPLMMGEEVEALPAFSGAVRHGPKRISIRYQGFKYIETPDPENYEMPPVIQPVYPRELYNLEKDPGEKVNIFDIEPTRTDLYHEELADFAKAGGAVSVEFDPSEIDPAMKERLRSLGYIQ